jgi:NAD+ kinase
MRGSTPSSGEAVRRAAVVRHGRPERLGDALARVEAVAAEVGVELVEPDGDPDVALVLGGDGTMLRALRTFLDSGVPVFGVNFGRVGFLTSVEAEQLEEGVSRLFRGDYSVVELPTLAVELGGDTVVALNDAVATSGELGRMVEIGWELGGEDLGVQPCDGMICSTPSGSTAYNLSNGGPVLIWGLDAMAVTFVAPHSLRTRPLVVPRGLPLTVRNATADVRLAVLSDGHRVGELATGESMVVSLGDQRSLLAVLPEVTFFSRLHAVFS